MFTVVKVRKLQFKRLDNFHSVVMELQWISKRGRMDCATPISFLCTSMKHPDVEDWKKLKSLLCFMNHTINDNIIVRANDLQEIQPYVYLSRAVHMDMRGHMVGVSTFDIGFLADKLSKQKMNSINSNES